MMCVCVFVYVRGGMCVFCVCIKKKREQNGEVKKKEPEIEAVTICW